MDGSFSTGAINVTIANSAATNSVFYGIAADSGGGTTQLMVSDSVMSNNGTGVFAGFGALVYLAKNTIAGNATAFTVSSATLSSFGDNYIKGNSDDGGAIPLVSAK
jgi:glucose uptake protein GlcU